MLQGVTALLERCGTDNPVMPPTELFNEGWMFRLVLDWFDRHREVGAARVHSKSTSPCWSRILLLTAAFFLASCKTAPIPTLPVIKVPPGLSVQQVELAILSGILNQRPPESYDPRSDMPDDEFQQLVWKHYLQSASARSWFPESRSPGVIEAAVNARSHYLRVALAYDTTSIRMKILESRNLRQSGGRIHKRAVVWLDHLEEHIRRELGRMSFAVGPVPSGGAQDERP